MPEAINLFGGIPSKLRNLIDADNIAEKLDNDERSWIARKVMEGYELDKSSRSDREEKLEQAMNMALQISSEKNYPWPKSSNIIFPLLTTATMEFAARAYPAIIQGDGVVKGKVIGEDTREEPNPEDPQGQPIVIQGEKAARAERIAEHMNYQLMEQMEEWEEGVDTLLHVLPIIGCCFRKTFYDIELKRSVSELVLPKYLYVNYAAKSLETAPRITQIFELYPNEIKEKQRLGIYLEDVELFYSSGDGGLDKEEDKDFSAQDEESPHLFLEQHRWLDLDEDGYEEPYIVTVHEQSGAVVRIVARYDKDSIIMNKNEVAQIKAEHYYTKYSFIPSPDGGFYGIGFGELLLSINISINTLLNQLIDAGHLAATDKGIIGRGIRMKAGALRFKPNEYKVIDVSGGTVRENVVQLTSQPPSPVLFQLLDLLIQSGKDIAGIKDVLSGEQVANIPATTTLSMVEQGLTSFKAIYKRMYRSLKEEFKKLYRLNQLYLPQESYYNVMDNPKAIKREDYNTQDVDVIPIADVSAVTNMQKFAKAQFLNEFRDDPTINREEITRRIFDAMNIEDVDKLIVPPPPPQPDPMMQLNMELIGVQIDYNEAQVKKIENQIELDNMEAYRKGFLTEADINKKNAEGLAAVARAEQAEDGLQGNYYKNILENMNEEGEKDVQETANISKRIPKPKEAMGGMERPTGNAGVSPVSPGLERGTS